MESLKAVIIQTLDSRGLDTFCASDFLELGNYDAIRKALERLTKDNIINRVIRGIYYKPKYISSLNMYSSPKLSEVANTISRSFCWKICPSGNMALNILGLSTQVPSRYVYLSNGPYVIYNIGTSVIEFKHSNLNELYDCSYNTLLVIQAIRTLGKENITNNVVKHLRDTLNAKDKEALLKESKRTTVWIYQIIKEICSDNVQIY